jgi:hypothetical protein
MSENARTRLAALREKKPPTKAAQLRSLWPEIRAALDNGHSLKAISECLAADGIAVSVRSLSVYVGRLRRNSMANRKLTPPTKTALARNVIPSPTAKSESVSAEQSQKGSRDPLANVREREKKRPGFDYRPELADPKELI